MLLAGVLGGLAVLAGVIITVLVVREATSADAGPDACVDQVLAQFGTDEELRRGEAAVAGRGDVAAVFTETRAQARERFGEIFADAPELGEQVPEDAVPASIWLRPTEGTPAAELADAVHGALLAGGAETVRAQPCRAGS